MLKIKREKLQEWEGGKGSQMTSLKQRYRDISVLRLLYRHFGGSFECITERDFPT